MTYRYFYAPCYHGPVLDQDTGEPLSETVKQPGPDSGSGVEYVATMPTGATVLKYDDPQTRCVVRMVRSSAPLAGWVQKTASEVLTDYPGLPGVI